jgi:hypothetical protein
MGGVKKLVSTFTGGLLDPLLGGPDIPKAKEKRREQAAGTDPNRGAEVAAARKRAAAASRGRSSFRIDLGGSDTGSSQTRGGLNVG